MVILVTILHTIMCIVLIAIVLLQTGKGASMGAAFGGATNTLFGGAGPASFLNKITTIAAVVFMITSFTLAVLSSQGGTASKVLEAVPTEQTQTPETEDTQVPASEENASETSTTDQETSQDEEQTTPTQ